MRRTESEEPWADLLASAEKALRGAGDIGGWEAGYAIDTYALQAAIAKTKRYLEGRVSE